MKLLLDENIDVRFKFFFENAKYEVLTVRDMEWNGIKNGKLLQLAAEYDFDAFLCVDKNLPYQQNLTTLVLPVIVLNVHRNVLSSLNLVLPNLLVLLNQTLQNQVYIVD
jgi:predicted nuclease of predicted toxin-antitoxin system